MAGGSSRVVYAALIGNVLVAGSKFAAATVSGSSAMLTEAVHSTADCVNQLLLLIGVRRGKLPADETHPFGYGMEIYFWTFVVAMLVLLLGGAFSLYQGIAKLASPEPVKAPLLSLAVLALSMLFEGSSFRVGYREYRKVARRHAPGQRVGLIQFIKWSKDPSLYESLLEDGAALVGIVVAATGIIANAYLGFLPGDGAASILIGFILIANGIAILVATRSLIAGEAAAPPVLRNLEGALDGREWQHRISELATLHLGPGCILVAATLLPDAEPSLEQRIARELEERLQAIDPRVIEVLFRLPGGSPEPGKA